MRRLVIACILALAAMFAPLQAGETAQAAAPLLTPWHQNVTVSITAAGWKNSQVLATGREGWVYAWSVRANTGCTQTAVIPYLVDQVTTSGTAAPSAAPAAEYRVAEESSTALTASAAEPSFATSFTEPMPFVDGLRIWTNIAGGTTCTLIVSVWGAQ